MGIEPSGITVAEVRQNRGSVPGKYQGKELGLGCRSSAASSRHLARSTPSRETERPNTLLRFLQQSFRPESAIVQFNQV